MSNENVYLSFDTKRTVNAQVFLDFDARNTFPCSDLDYSDLSINLGSHTLSDTFQMQIPNGNLGFDYLVEGTLEDFPYQFKVEEIEEQNKMMSYIGRYSSDKLLYTTYTLSISYSKSVHDNQEPENVSYSVRALMQKMCSHLGFTLIYNAWDWQYPLNKIGEDDDYWYFGLKGTYASLMNQIFGWLSDLPHIDFNVYIREGILLYVVQRGHEDGGTVTITNPAFPYRIQKRRIRTEWQGNNTKKEKQYDDPENQVPFTGTIQWGDISITYEEGYVVRETDNQGNTTTYTYTEINDAKYVSRKKTENVNTGSSTDTVYDYRHFGDEIYLAKETQTVITVEGEPPATIEEREVTVTTHTPTGNGWYGHNVLDEEGNIIQTSLSQGAPGNSVSPYMVEQTQAGFNTLTQQIVHDIIEGLLEYLHPPLINTTYPVKDQTTIRNLIDATDWLNGKTEEKVTLEVLNSNHIIDFNDVISFKGNTYRLESNNVRHSAEYGLRQSIVIVRWY